MNRKDLRKYKRAIKKKLPYSHKKQKEILTDLFEQIEEYTENHPDCNLSDVQAQFGTPDTIVVSALSPEETVDCSKRSKRIKIWAGLAILLAAGLAFTSYLLYRINESGSNYHKFSSSELEPTYQNQGD
ncbi:MAG: hypothetical protein IJX39_03830 [Clostridia bacterium]|nr:hypothetical protein [Clostridia bacterium]